MALGRVEPFPCWKGRNSRTVRNRFRTLRSRFHFGLSRRETCETKRPAENDVLLDQALLAGLGNIYADESLHLARLHPSRPANSLSAEEIERLHAAIGEILNRAVSQGGAYADRQAQNQANIEGFESIYTPRIYDRPGQPCPVCGEPLVKFQLRGRGATFCPMCQPDANIPAG